MKSKNLRHHTSSGSRGEPRPCVLMAMLCFAVSPAAPPWHAVQREPRVGGVQGEGVACGCAQPSPAEGHCWPPGTGVHPGGAAGVDGVRAADPGLQRHRGRALERGRQGSDAGVGWVQAPQKTQEIHHFLPFCSYFNFLVFGCWVGFFFCLLSR